MEPTRIAKPKVLSIQALESNVAKSVNTCSNDAITAKSFKTKIPKTIPPKSDISTFLV